MSPKVNCSTCYGTGKKAYLKDHDNKTYYKKCPHCNGSGKEEMRCQRCRKTTADYEGGSKYKYICYHCYCEFQRMLRQKKEEGHSFIKW